MEMKIIAGLAAFLAILIIIKLKKEYGGSRGYPVTRRREFWNRIKSKFRKGKK